MFSSTYIWFYFTHWYIFWLRILLCASWVHFWARILLLKVIYGLFGASILLLKVIYMLFGARILLWKYIRAQNWTQLEQSNIRTQKMYHWVFPYQTVKGLMCPIQVSTYTYYNVNSKYYIFLNSFPNTYYLPPYEQTCKAYYNPKTQSTSEQFPSFFFPKIHLY